jgi:hypothetical protein
MALADIGKTQKEEWVINCPRLKPGAIDEERSNE